MLWNWSLKKSRKEKFLMPLMPHLLPLVKPPKSVKSEGFSDRLEVSFPHPGFDLKHASV